MQTLFRKLRWLVRRRAKEAELREELSFHLEEEAVRRREDGSADDEARRTARQEFGNQAVIEEDTRAAWGWRRLEQVARDARHGVRQIRRNPGFSAIAILTLALGIGGVTAIFSVFYAVLTVTLFVPVLGGLYVPRAGRREGLASILTGTSVLVATHVLTRGHGYGIVSPALCGVIASALGFAGSFLAGSRRR